MDKFINTRLELPNTPVSRVFAPFGVPTVYSF